MSTYLALTFGTLLSSQGTDTSFELPSQYLRALRSVLRFVLYSAYQIRLTAFSDFLADQVRHFCGDRHSTVFPDQVRTMSNPHKERIQQGGHSVNVMIAPVVRASFSAAPSVRPVLATRSTLGQSAGPVKR
ncbi:hypothetical protein P3T36_001595 [Kitasatospora sp. MAP12-15]|uniref:hypothetical protein n=1 Tax=unclassified Kitasatospora TaxID=2633591 RepID=UPI003D1F8A9A